MKNIIFLSLIVLQSALISNTSASTCLTDWNNKEKPAIVERVNALTENKNIRNYLINQLTPDFGQADNDNWRSCSFSVGYISVDKAEKVFKYCTYWYPEYADMTLDGDICRFYRTEYGQNITIDVNLQKKFDAAKKKVKSEIDALEKQKHMLYDYDVQAKNLNEKLANIEEQEADIKYVKFIHKANYRSVFCKKNKDSSVCK